MDERGPPPSSVSGFVATNIESAVPSFICFFTSFLKFQCIGHMQRRSNFCLKIFSVESWRLAHGTPSAYILSSFSHGYTYFFCSVAVFSLLLSRIISLGFNTQGAIQLKQSIFLHWLCQCVFEECHNKIFTSQIYMRSQRASVVSVPTFYKPDDNTFCKP